MRSINMIKKGSGKVKKGRESGDFTRKILYEIKREERMRTLGKLLNEQEIKILGDELMRSDRIEDVKDLVDILSGTAEKTYGLLVLAAIRAIKKHGENSEIAKIIINKIIKIKQELYGVKNNLSKLSDVCLELEVSAWDAIVKHKANPEEIKQIDREVVGLIKSLGGY